jgi:hypothetical protein
LRVTTRLVAAAALAALAFPASASTTGNGVTTLYAWSGRGDIGISRVGVGDEMLRRVKAGVYRIYVVVRYVRIEQRPMNFHLECVSLNRATRRGFTGAVTWWVRLRPGTCRYYSDFGESRRARTFRVV